MRFKRQQITAAVHDDNKQPARTIPFPALVLGQLAVHRGLIARSVNEAEGDCPWSLYDATGHWYVITHIPSGYKLAEGSKQQTCKRLVEQLNVCGVDWQFNDTRNLPDEFFTLAKPLIVAFISDTSN